MQYIWLAGSLFFLLIWLIIYFSLRDKISRKEMFIVSLWTAPLGLTEPLFIPEYWNPPSLFNLAQKTGFDIESLIFSFSLGGLAAVFYEWVFKGEHKKISLKKKGFFAFQYHLFSLFSAPLIFFLFLIFTNLNPIYLVIISLLGGGFLTLLCRPDLKRKMFLSGFFFFLLYFFSFLILVWFYPDYIPLVWNLKALSGILILGIPLEELLFAFSLGFLWASFYEHLKGYQFRPKSRK